MEYGVDFHQLTSEACAARVDKLVRAFALFRACVMCEACACVHWHLPLKADTRAARAAAPPDQLPGQPPPPATFTKEQLLAKTCTSRPGAVSWLINGARRSHFDAWHAGGCAGRPKLYKTVGAAVVAIHQVYLGNGPAQLAALFSNEDLAPYLLAPTDAATAAAAGAHETDFSQSEACAAGRKKANVGPDEYFVGVYVRCPRT